MTTTQNTTATMETARALAILATGDDQLDDWLHLAASHSHAIPVAEQFTVRVRSAAEGGPRAASIRVVAQSLGCGPETLRNWCRRAEASDLTSVAVPTSASLEEENRQLRRELAETRRANEILKKASA
jgi:transposase